jgi:hypothetical protein
MGFALHWAALKGGNLRSICSVFNLRSTGRREEIPEFDFAGFELPTGWSLVLFHGKTIKDELLEELSRSGEVVSCFVEDHVMFSTASGWRNQGPTRSVTHDCEKGRFHLEIQGVVPPALEGIQSSMVALRKAAGGEKAEVDHIYDIPAELAREVTGFRHDQDIPGLSGDAYDVLEPTKEASHGAGARGLLGRLFGKQRRQ